MKKLYPVLFAIAAIFVASFAASAQMMKENPMVGGAAMYPTKTIVANAMNSADHTTLVAAVKAAGLVDTLNSKGPSRFSHRPTRPLNSCPRALSRCF